ncbi:MAG: MOSC N-terminal beta barrel domain-containing protein [Elusimicrobia bacterium]|nr:MOSC N-terminal beta barrel domain-containing protein [Elusimicrobiota bacterium]
MRVTRLFYYPVKSLGGIETDRLELSRRGPRFDREWVVAGLDGDFLTQRQHPRMCLLSCSMGERSLRISCAGRQDLEIPLAHSEKAGVTVSVWGDSCRAFDEGDAAAAWLSSFLGAPCRLARVDPGFRRPLEDGYRRPGDWTAFADGFPLLAVTEESLADLGRRAARTFEAERFRPNIVVAGAPAWSEDSWQALRSGDLVLRAAKPCSRCSITTLDPRTGEAGPEPLRTLAGFRRKEGAVLFGVNLVPESDGALRVGDPLTV